MKQRILLGIAFLLFLVPTAIRAQVFGTGQTLRSGKASLGVEPVLYSYANGHDDFYLFLHGGYGLRSGLDLGLKVGVLGPRDYFGADLEWNLAPGNPAISLSVGGHQYFDFGLDATLNVSFPLGKSTHLYTGLDADVIFAEPETRTPSWLPLGVEVAFRQNASLLLEGEFGLNGPAWNIMGGGLNFYF